jgi:GTP-binding protein Era
MTEPAFHAGTAALIGRPNAGKSTLLNQILGAKLAITSSKPQTTRDRIVGIHTDARMQVVLHDTPGIHLAFNELNKAMVRRATEVLSEVDVVCWLEDTALAASRIDAGKPVLDAAGEAISTMLRDAGTPVILLANKLDVVAPQYALPVIDALRQAVPLRAAVPLSALTGDGMPDLLAELYAALPDGPPLYPAETWTEATERFLVAEIIREKIFHLTSQEVPYATAVDVLKFDESERETEGRIRIFAQIITERPSQKGILIGRRGEMLKRIGSLARKELNELLDARVHLDLHVKVEPDWTRTASGLKKVGYE